MIEGFVARLKNDANSFDAILVSLFFLKASI